MPQNPLFRLLAWNWLAGAGAAVTLLVGLIATNAMRLRDLIFSSEDPFIPIMLLLFGFLITFCSVAMGTAIMSLGEATGDGTGGRRSKAATDDGRLDASSRRAGAGARPLNNGRAIRLPDRTMNPTDVLAATDADVAGFMPSVAL